MNSIFTASYSEVTRFALVIIYLFDFQTVAGGAYVYGTVTAATVRSTVRRLRDLKE